MTSMLESEQKKEKTVTIHRVRERMLHFIPYIGLILVVVFFGVITEGRILSFRNSSVLLSEIFSIALGATGVIFLMSQGNMDFSLGALAGFAAALGAIAAGTNTLFLFPVTILAGLAVGFINGMFVAKFNVPSFIATLAVSFVLKGLTITMLNGSIGIPFAMSKYDNDVLKLAVLVAVLVIGYIMFEYTEFGKQGRAIGSLPEAARQSGVNLTKIRWFSFVLSGLVCGLIGFFSAVRACTVSTSTGIGLEFNVLLALMIGGFSLTGGWTAKFRSVIIGSLIMAFISNGMTLAGINGGVQQLIKGFLFIIAVAVSFDRKNIAVIK